MDASPLDIVPPDSRRVVLGCVADAGHEGQIVDALSGVADLKVFDRFTQLHRYLMCRPVRPAAVVLSSRDRHGAVALGLIEWVSSNYRGLPVIAWIADRPGAPVSMRALAAAGVHAFLFEKLADSEHIRETVLSRGPIEAITTAVMQGLADAYPSGLLDVLECVLLHPRECHTVTGLARLLGVSVVTLEHRCSRANAPKPEDLLSWTRLFLPCYLLGTTGRTVRSLFEECGFPSETALRNMIKGRLLMTASEVRAAGGLTIAAAAFSNRLSMASRRAGTAIA